MSSREEKKTLSSSFSKASNAVVVMEKSSSFSADKLTTLRSE
jgi:hypothetical protein